MAPSLEQHRRVMAALQQPWDEEHTYGETPYHAFFMKYRGEYSGNKSVSDWVNRVNDYVCRHHGTDAATAKSATGKKKEGRG